ncbi:MAG TPA: Gfo/Idh/MocA family oxidoreductase [Candidatus Butyricicoccus stercorigallinarum]|nr:Gfo/Idh/MocA family oxidoreductase [Candidatus Butyricicoccus stercorigallinarum]
MKLGIIGTGTIVHAVLSAIRPIDGIQFSAVYSRREQTGAALAGAFDIPRVHTDLEQFLTDDTVDTVYIASPNSLHYAQARRALEHGKHVVVEKPITSTLREAEELYRIALSRGLFLFEAVTTHALPNYQYIKENLPRLGRLRIVLCSFSQYSSRYDALLAGQQPNVFLPKFSGGALEDINLYNIQFVMGLFGEPDSTDYTPNQHENGIDTSGVAVLRYPDFVCVCEGAKDTTGVNSVQIQGEKGYLYVDGDSNGCPEVRLVLRDGTEERCNRQDRPRWFYEFEQMQALFAQGDLAACHQKLTLALQVVKHMESMRKRAGILFDADTGL